MKDIYGNSIIGKHQLNNQFVGKIVDLENWDTTYMAKIYIKELMPSIDYGKKVINETMYNSNLKNSQYSNHVINITIDNGIECKQVSINNRLVKPEVGDHVIVEFVDNDIKKGIYYNMSYVNYDNVKIGYDEQGSGNVSEEVIENLKNQINEELNKSIDEIKNNLELSISNEIIKINQNFDSIENRLNEKIDNISFEVEEKIAEDIIEIIKPGIKEEVKNEIEDSLSEIKDGLENEIINRKENDNLLQNQIKLEKTNREKVDNELRNKIEENKSNITNITIEIDNLREEVNILITSIINNKIEEATIAIKNDVQEYIDNELEEYATEEYVINKIAEAQLEGEGVDLSRFATKEDLALKADKGDIPLLDGYATEEYVQEAIESIEIQNIDLSSYATKQYVQDQIDEIEFPEVPEVPSLDGYATEEFVQDQIDQIEFPNIPSIEGLATEEFVQEAIESIEFPEMPSLDGYATEEFVTNKIAEAQLDGGEVDLSGYATKDELNNKADKSEIPNIEGLATEEFVQEAINAIEFPEVPEIDLSKYATKDELNNKVNKIEGKSLIDDNEIERLKNINNYDDTEIRGIINNKANKSDIPSLDGYATEEFVTNKIAEAQLDGGEVDLSGYATKTDITSVHNLINTEKQNRNAADNTLNTKISEETAARLEQINSLQDQIYDEIAARQLADSTIMQQLENMELEIDEETKNEIINEVKSGMENEVSEIVNNQIDNRILETENKITSAENIVNGKIGTLEEQLNEEIQNRSNDIGELINQITTEVSNRESADGELQNQIDEILNQVDNEVSNRESADGELQNQINEISNAIKEIPKVNIDSLQEEINSLGSNLSTEISNRESADGELQNQIDEILNQVDNEVATRESVDSALQNQINDEIAYRVAADNEIQGEISTIKADIEILKNPTDDGGNSDLEERVTNVENLLSGEETTRINADNAIWEYINSLELRLKTAEAKIEAILKNNNGGVSGEVYSNPTMTMENHKAVLTEGDYTEVFNISYEENLEDPNYNSSVSFTDDDGYQYHLMLTAYNADTNFRYNHLYPSDGGWMSTTNKNGEVYRFTYYPFPTHNNWNFTCTVQNIDNSVNSDLLTKALEHFNTAFPALNMQVADSSRNTITQASYADTWLGLHTAYNNHFEICINDDTMHQYYEPYGTSTYYDRGGWLHTTIHEFGHTLGLRDQPVHTPSIFNYQANVYDRGGLLFLQPNDLYAMQYFYQTNYGFDINSKSTQAEIDAQTGITNTSEPPSEADLSLTPSTMSLRRNAPLADYTFDYAYFSANDINIVDNADAVMRCKLTFDKTELIDIAKGEDEFILEYNLYKIEPTNIFKGELTNDLLKIHVSEDIEIDEDSEYLIYIMQYDNIPCSLISIKQGLIKIPNEEEGNVSNMEE